MLIRLYVLGLCTFSSLAVAQTVVPARIELRTNAAEAVLTIDGELRGLAPRTEALAPGVHTVVAETKGAPPVTQTFSVSAGESRTVTLQFSMPAAPRPFPAVGTLMVASGGVLVGGGLLLRTRAEAAAEHVSSLFRQGGGWDAQGQQRERDGIAAETWSWVFVSVGSAVAAAGVVVGFLEYFGAPKAARPVLTFVPTPGGAFVSGAITW